MRLVALQLCVISVLQCVEVCAVCCSVLQCSRLVALLPCVINVLQCVAVC